MSDNDPLSRAAGPIHPCRAYCIRAGYPMRIGGPAALPGQLSPAPRSVQVYGLASLLISIRAKPVRRRDRLDSGTASKAAADTADGAGLLAARRGRCKAGLSTWADVERGGCAALCRSQLEQQSPPTGMGPEPISLGTPHLAVPRLLTAQENRAGRELAMDDCLRGLADCGPDAADIGKFAAFA